MSVITEEATLTPEAVFVRVAPSNFNCSVAAVSVEGFNPSVDNIIPESDARSRPISSEGSSTTPAPNDKNSSLPFFLIPAPASICPAPENCSNDILVEPTVIASAVTRT